MDCTLVGLPCWNIFYLWSKSKLLTIFLGCAQLLEPSNLALSPVQRKVIMFIKQNVDNFSLAVIRQSSIGRNTVDSQLAGSNRAVIRQADFQATTGIQYFFWPMKRLSRHCIDSISLTLPCHLGILDSKGPKEKTDIAKITKSGYILQYNSGPD